MQLWKNVKKLCFVSSIAACGPRWRWKNGYRNLRWVDDENRSAYSRSKFYSEAEVWKGIKGLKAVIVNPEVILVIVRGQVPEVHRFFQSFVLPLYGWWSGYVDVRDVVRAMIELTKSDISGEKIYLVSENCSNRSFIMDGWWIWQTTSVDSHRKNVYLAGWYFVEIVGKILGSNPGSTEVYEVSNE